MQIVENNADKTSKDLLEEILQFYSFSESYIWRNTRSIYFQLIFKPYT